MGEAPETTPSNERAAEEGWVGFFIYNLAEQIGAHAEPEEWRPMLDLARELLSAEVAVRFVVPHDSEHHDQLKDWLIAARLEGAELISQIDQACRMLIGPEAFRLDEIHHRMCPACNPALTAELAGLGVRRPSPERGFVEFM